jgi:hypothetical protein
MKCVDLLELAVNIDSTTEVPLFEIILCWHSRVVKST